MGNSVYVKRHVDPDIFKQFIKSRGVSIRQLGSYCACNDRTIRRTLKCEEITLNVALDIAAFFDADFDELFGPDDSYAWTRSKKRIFSQVK